MNDESKITVFRLRDVFRLSKVFSTASVRISPLKLNVRDNIQIS